MPRHLELQIFRNPEQNQMVGAPLNNAVKLSINFMTNLVCVFVCLCL